MVILSGLSVCLLLWLRTFWKHFRWVWQNSGLDLCDVTTSTPREIMREVLWRDDDDNELVWVEDGKVCWVLKDWGIADPKRVKLQVENLIEYDGRVYGKNIVSFKQWFATPEGKAAISKAENHRLFQDFIDNMGKEEEE
jgi:hypothetical protein